MFLANASSFAIHRRKPLQMKEAVKTRHLHKVVFGKAGGHQEPMHAWVVTVERCQFIAADRTSPGAEMVLKQPVF
jgi:hypothetical protein